MNIELKNVSFSYDSDTLVLDNLSLKLKSGEMVAILGHNGSGKSTLSKVIMGLLEVDSGNIYFDNELISGDDFDKVRGKMGIIFQNPDNQFVGVTVQDDIAFGLENRRIPKEEMEERIKKYSKIVNMEDYLLTVPYPITVAIMGCVVNGPGEATHADIGIAGGNHEGLLFKHGKIVRKLKEEEFEEVLKEEIQNLIKEKYQ